MSDMNPAQARQCALYLDHLRRTGSYVFAAAAAGLKPTTMDSRRRRHPEFGHACEAARAFGLARLAAEEKHATRGSGGSLTGGGEYTVRRGKHGRAQVRRAQAGELSAAGLREVLATVAATANIRLAAEVAGVSEAAIHARRHSLPWFADQIDIALREGVGRIEAALLESAIHSLDPTALALADWQGEDARAAAEPLLGRLTFEQALQALGQHRRYGDSGTGRRGNVQRNATREETNAVLLRALQAAKKRVERKDRD